MRILYGVAALAALLAAAPSSAVSLLVQSVGIYNPGIVHASPLPGGDRDEYAVPVHFTGAYAGRARFDFDGFCVDLFHNINVGFGSQLPVNLSYHVAPLTSDGSGNPLTTAQVRSIGGLANLGFALIGSSDPDRNARMAAIQAAIWTIEYPTIGFTANNSFAGLQGFVDQYVAMAPSLSGYARAIYADNGQTQGFIISAPGVPEPAIWAQLVTGFALTGATIRRRRNRPAQVIA